MTANITQDVHAEPARNANDMEISTRTLGFPVNAAAVLAPIVTSAVVGGTMPAKTVWTDTLEQGAHHGFRTHF